MKNVLSRGLLPALAVLLVAGDRPSGDKRLDRIRVKAEETRQAFVSGDYATLVKLTHPKVVERIGGREKMIEMITAGRADMKDKGIVLHSMTVEAPVEVLTGNPHLFAVVPDTLKFTIPGGKMTQKSFLLAVSEDQGKTWTFIDGAGLARIKVRDLLPNFPKDAKLPEKQPPVIEKSE